jgi:hypothetical protein
MLLGHLIYYMVLWNTKAELSLESRFHVWSGANVLKHYADYPSVKHLKGASLGWGPALPTNIRLGLKGLPGTSALAYYENP